MKATASKRKKSSTKKSEKNCDLKSLSEVIKRVIKTSAPIYSLSAYWDNGYQQWGAKVKEFVFQNRYIRPSFVKFRADVRDLTAITNEMDVLCKRRDKDALQYAEKLCYKLMDISDDLTRLNKAIYDSNICNLFPNEKFIFETGRRLGLRELALRASTSTYKMTDLIKEIEQYKERAYDNIEYDPYFGRIVSR